MIAVQDNQDSAPSVNNKNRDQRFVDTVIDRCQKDKGMAARLRRADNPATEYQSWELLGWFGVNIEKDYERLPFVTVAAAIAKSKVERNGSLALGKAILACYENDPEDGQAKARLRRLLACDELAEVCRVLRPVLTLIDSKTRQPLDYIRLLRQLRFFGHRTKTQWAQEFYGRAVGVEGVEGVA
ncbi:MAG: type I-E CRISPR-associated protein Cse2/CasB [Shewanella algae]